MTWPRTGSPNTALVQATGPVTTFEVADKSALTVGAHVVVRAFKADDGTLTAGYISIGKNGFVPG